MSTDKWIKKVSEDVSEFRTEFLFASSKRPDQFANASDFPLLLLAYKGMVMGINSSHEQLLEGNQLWRAVDKFGIPCSSMYLNRSSEGRCAHVGIALPLTKMGFIDFVGTGTDLNLVRMIASMQAGRTKKEYPACIEGTDRISVIAITYGKHYSTVERKEVVKEVIVDVRIVKDIVPAYFYSRPNNYYTIAALLGKEEPEVNVLTYVGQLNTDLETYPEKLRILQHLNEYQNSLNQGFLEPGEEEKTKYSIFKKFL